MTVPTQANLRRNQAAYVPQPSEGGAPNGWPWNFLAFAPETIDIRFIATMLARIDRCHGRSPLPYSAAQHALLVASFLPARLRRHGLLHAAHEAITGGIPLALREAIRQAVGQDIVAALAQPWQVAIHAACGLTWPPPIRDADLIKAAERQAMATTMRDLLDAPPQALPCAPGLRALCPWPWAKAEQKFLDEWERLTACVHATAAA
jgi:uncharacterized protein